jgi:transcriptional regulator with XRE-family HTH domain
LEAVVSIGCSAVAPVDHRLAQALRRLRVQRGLSQETVAHRADISYTTLAKIESGRSNPTWTTVRRVAAALEVTLVELVSEVEAADAPPGRRTRTG